VLFSDWTVLQEIPQELEAVDLTLGDLEAATRRLKDKPNTDTKAG